MKGKLSHFSPEITAAELRTAGRLTLATHNAGKVQELRAALAATGLAVTGAENLAAPEEGHDSFEANALLKARFAAAALGTWALADDSGLCVEALDGAPGVDTAHFGGWERLLAVLKDVPEPRRARFECVLALCAPDGRAQIFRGTCAGVITQQAQGDGGFGYDPVFRPEGAAVTFAAMDAAVKQGLSHRGQALRALCDWLTA